MVTKYHQKMVTLADPRLFWLVEVVFTNRHVYIFRSFGPLVTQRNVFTEDAPARNTSPINPPPHTLEMTTTATATKAATATTTAYPILLLPERLRVSDDGDAQLRLSTGVSFHVLSHRSCGKCRHANSRKSKHDMKSIDRWQSVNGACQETLISRTHTGLPQRGARLVGSLSSGLTLVSMWVSRNPSACRHQPTVDARCNLASPSYSRLDRTATPQKDVLFHLCSP